MSTRSASNTYPKYCDFFLYSTLMSKEADTTAKHSQFQETLYFKVHLKVWERKGRIQDCTAHRLVPIPPKNPQRGVLQRWGARSMANPCRAITAWSLSIALVAQVGGQRCTQHAWLLPTACSHGTDMISPRPLRKCWGKALVLNVSDVLDVVEENEKENIHVCSLPQLPNNFSSVASNR